MKSILFLFFILYIPLCFGQGKANLDLKTKSQKVREKLLSVAPLPAGLKKEAKRSPMDTIFHTYKYLTKRTEDKKTNSVTMNVMILSNDTLKHLDFDEVYYDKGKEGKVYHYAVNKNGVIDMAFVQKTRQDRPLFEINLTLPDSIHLPDSIYHKPDKKVFEKYDLKAMTTVNELYKMLFK